MVDVSMTVLPTPSAGNMASITSTTSGELGTHRKITSEASAPPSGEPPSTAPWDTAASMGPRPREATVTSWPAATRGPAMGRPMAPSPMNPMRMRVPPGCRSAGGELGQPLRRAGEELVDHGVGGTQVATAGQGGERESLPRQRAVAPQRRLHGEFLGGDVAPHDFVVGRRQRGAVAAADAVVVNDTD